MALAAADAALADLRKRLVGTNPVIGRLEQDIVQVSGELAMLRVRYTSDHSEVIAAERKLQRLQDERRQVFEASKSIDTQDIDRLWNIAAGLAQGDRNAPPLLVTQMQNLQEAQSRRTALTQDVEQLRRSMADLQAGMAASGSIEQELQQLERALVQAREAHDALAKRYELARVTGALGTFEAPERIKVADATGDPSQPASPPRILFVLGGLVAGLALGCALTFLAEMFDPVVRHAAEFARIFGAPLLGRLPRPTIPMTSQ